MGAQRKGEKELSAEQASEEATKNRGVHGTGSADSHAGLGITEVGNIRCAVNCGVKT